MARRAIVLEFARFRLPFAAGPLLGERPDDRLIGGLLDESERGLDDLSLCRTIVGWPARVAERVVQECRPRRVRRRRDRPGRRQAGGDETLGFEMAGDQTNCLVADRSNRHQEDDVGRQLPQFLGERGDEFFVDTTLRVDPAHERQPDRSQ